LKILFDTNIVLDVLLCRAKFVELSANLFAATENQQITGFLSATTITTLDYLISKTSTRKKARAQIQNLLKIFKIADVNSTVIENSLKSDFRDFEDAVQYFSGKFCKVNGLVTRNIKDYKVAQYPIYLPSELSAIISSKN